jgi:hypothetical protein
MKSILVIVLTFGAPWICVAGPAKPAEADGVAAVSFIRLLTEPERYEGKRIEVLGYLTAQGRLYLTKDHAAERDAMSSVMVSDTDQGEITSSSCVDSYVRIRGRLEQADVASFIIVDVERAFQPSQGAECWALTPRGGEKRSP